MTAGDELYLVKGGGLDSENRIEGKGQMLTPYLSKML